MEKDNKIFGTIGMALSCTLFLEGALKRYHDCALSVDEDMVELIREWNKVLISLLTDERYKSMLGDVGEKLVRYTSKNRAFATKCVEEAEDVNVQALHYVLRFNENVRYLDNKYKLNSETKFCDLGCGFSPLGIAFQNKYNLSDVYCIDIVPEIADLCTCASYKLSGKIPSFISWNQAKDLAKENKLNTITSLGCLPHMPLQMQKEYLKTINKLFENFFIEIKYKSMNGVHNSENAFDIEELKKLRMDVENVSNVETAMIYNSLRYLLKFARAKPNRMDFLVNQSRSLFLSR